MNESDDKAEIILYGSFTPSSNCAYTKTHRKVQRFTTHLDAAIAGIAGSIAGQTMKPEAIARRAAEIAQNAMIEVYYYTEHEYIRETSR